MAPGPGPSDSPARFAHDILPIPASDGNRPESRDIDALAAALLDLACSYEHALRTVLSVHRLVERVRCCGEGEAKLLVQEMSRHVDALSERAGGAPDLIATACLRIASLKRDTIDERKPHRTAQFRAK